VLFKKQFNEANMARPPELTSAPETGVALCNSGPSPVNSGMADEPDSLILRMLRAIDAKVDGQSIRGLTPPH
jgi:hypothetical protein